MKQHRVILMGGLGNQLFQYAFALELSERTQSAVILDPNFLSIRKDDSGNLDLEKYALDSKIQIEATRPTPLLLRKIIGFALRMHLKPGNRLHDYFCTFLRFISTIVTSIHLRNFELVYISKDNGYVEPGKIFGSTFFVGYFQSYRYLQSLKSDITEIRLKNETRSDEIGEFLKSSDDDIPLAVHIRLTDYRNEPNFGVLSQKYYSNAIAYHFGKFEYSRIWLFSDEPEIALEFIPTQYRPLVINVSKLVSSTVETLELMRMAKGFVIANSSFSWWAAHLSRQKMPFVTFPSPWFANMTEPRDLIPPNWQSIDR
jgi:hypothetical protein